MTMKRLLFIAAVSAISAAMQGSAYSADAENGRRLAERWCVACHAVSTAPKTTTEAPPFSAVASKPDFNAGGLALFLLHPHPKMPDMGLSRDAAADLTAFIARQRQ